VNKFTPKSLVAAIASCLLGVILALVGAELPSDTSFAQALPFWLTIACTAALLLTTLETAIDRLIEDIRLTSFLKTSLSGATTIALVTTPVALMCLPIDSLIPDQDTLFSAAETADPVSGLFWAWADQYWNLLPAIAGFWLFIKAIDFALPLATDSSAKRDLNGSPKVDASPEETTQPRDNLIEHKPSALERRFPEIAGLTLLAIEADEHYVRLHTNVGSKHVLYRFRDALKDVEDRTGLRVHRSWWVAEDALEKLERGPSGFGLRLKGGLKVPVSQTYRRDVERMMGARSDLGSDMP